jgi:tRNA nucleotidyltransferase/poly(A) polymerase
MARNDQPDLFETDTQAELFDEDAPPVLYHADPDRVRARLHKILAEARAAQTMPWNAKEIRLYRTIFPQMTNWLPNDEAAQLRSEFESELARLGA